MGSRELTLRLIFYCGSNSWVTFSLKNLPSIRKFSRKSCRTMFSHGVLSKLFRSPDKGMERKPKPNFLFSSLDVVDYSLSLRRLGTLEVHKGRHGVMTRVGRGARGRRPAPPCAPVRPRAPPSHGASRRSRRVAGSRPSATRLPA